MFPRTRAGRSGSGGKQPVFLALPLHLGAKHLVEVRFPPRWAELVPSRLNQRRAQAGRRRRRRVSGLISPRFIGNELHAVVCLYNQGEAAEVLAKAPKIS